MDELVLKASELYRSKALNEFVKLMLMAAQEVLSGRLMRGEHLALSCCGGHEFVLNGGYDRAVRTSVGDVELFWRRVKCKRCGKSFTLLRELMKLDSYQTKTGELEKLVVDSVAETSYRRAVVTLEGHGVVSVPHSTAHRWVLRTDCDEIELSNDVFGSAPATVVADGTKFKGLPKDGEARRGDLKVALGVSSDGRMFPLGAYAGTSWQEVGEDWKKRELKLPEGSVLLADGEEDISTALAKYADYEQRCHWHAVEGLYFSMYPDGGRAKDSRPLQKGLAGVLAIELPEGDFAKVTEAEKDGVEERMELAEEAMSKLSKHLWSNGYHTAADYIDRARKNVFGYVRRWLRFGIICPRASSLVERVMRELGRRLKKIAYGWSDAGITKVAKIILKRFSDIDAWEEYWAKRMNSIGNVVLTLWNVKCQHNT